MKTITFVNAKGGVGKTTLCANIGKGLDRRFREQVYRSVFAPLTNPLHGSLYIDSDPQGSLRDWHDANSISQNIIRAETLIVGDTNQSLLSGESMAEKMGYQYCLIDTPGEVHPVISTSLYLADYIIVPIQPSALDVWATIDTIDLINHRQHKVPVLFIINRALSNSTLPKDVTKALIEAATFDFRTIIVNGRLSFARTMNQGRTVYESRDMKAIKEINHVIDIILEDLDDHAKNPKTELSTDAESS